MSDVPMSPHPAVERAHAEPHRSLDTGWLRAAVLGGNDGIVSTASLVTGLAAAQPDGSTVLMGGLAGLVAGALSMAAGEYVSVASERDAQRADVALELWALEAHPEEERLEMVARYVDRGLAPELAEQVAEQLMAKDALGAHLHEELRLDPDDLSNPWQAALASGGFFAAGATPPVLVAALAPADAVLPAVMGTTALLLVGLGAFAAAQARASRAKGIARVTLGGGLAMGLSALVGHLLGPLVG